MLPIGTIRVFRVEGGFKVSVPSDAARSIVNDERTVRHRTNRPTIVQQRSTLGVYRHVLTASRPTPSRRCGWGRRR